MENLNKFINTQNFGGTNGYLNKFKWEVCNGFGKFSHYFQFRDRLIITACIKKLCEKKEVVLSGQEPALRINFQIS